MIRTHKMNKKDVTLAYFLFFSLLLQIIGAYEWINANEVAHDAVCITLMILGPLTILNGIATLHWMKDKEYSKRREGGKKDEA